MDEQTRRALVHAFRNEWASVFAATVRLTRDIDLAEEIVQDAFAEALTTWVRDGVPKNPGAWLTTTAKRRAIDSIRRTSNYRTRIQLLVESESLGDDVDAPRRTGDGLVHAVADDTMRLIFMCCHPSLSIEAKMALTLRLVCGMTTKDIARCFLVSEPTMAARLTRAKRKIAVARIPFRVPSALDLPGRVDAVLGVIYLLYTIGHTAPSGETLIREETVGEALRLARLLHALVPEEREVSGLLALLLVSDARRASRVGEDGRAKQISDQDRSTWNQEMVREARDLIDNNFRNNSTGRYTLQAAIAAQHTVAPTYEEVDWHEIVRLYDELIGLWSSPIVQLNRAVAVSKTSGPQVALAIIEGLESDGRLDRYQYLPAIKAYLLDQLGRDNEAEQARTRAFELASNEVERDYLASQLHSAQPR